MNSPLHPHPTLASLCNHARKRWYSPTGAKRGLVLAGLASVFWLGWALGYSQAPKPSPGQHLRLQAPDDLHATGLASRALDRPHGHSTLGDA